MAAAFPRNSGGIAKLFKKGWNEIPEVIGSAFMGLVGVSLTFAGLYNYYYIKDGDNRKHKLQYVVIRDDDPRAATVRSGING